MNKLNVANLPQKILCSLLLVIDMDDVDINSDNLGFRIGHRVKCHNINIPIDDRAVQFVQDQIQSDSFQYTKKQLVQDLKDLKDIFKRDQVC